MKKSRFLFAIPFLLFSCSNGASLNAKREKLKSAQQPNEEIKKLILESESKTNDIINVEKNAIYSPLTDAAVNLIGKAYEGDESALTQYKTLSEMFNVEVDKFFYESNALVAAETIDDDLEKKLNNNYISTFEGSPSQISKYVSKIYGDDCDFGETEFLDLNILSFKDSFSTPLEKSKKDIFHGTAEVNTTFYLRKSESSIVDNDVYTAATMTIYHTTLTIIMAKEGHSLKEINANNIYNLSSEKTGIVEFEIPQFSVNSQICYNVDDPIYQVNQFEFTKEGVKGKSVAAKGPTAADPSFEFKFTVDHPFIFASCYQGIPLMVGSVNNL